VTPDLPQVETTIVRLANDFRRSEDRRALRRNRVLDAIARSYARYLARTGKFSHTADGRQPAERADRGGYAYCQFAENLALNGDSRGFRTRQLARDAMTGWKNSPGHRANLLRPYVTETGVGVAKAPDKQTYISVQLFGRPSELRFSFRVKNLSNATVDYAYRDDAHEISPRVIATHEVCRPGAVAFTFGAGSSQANSRKVSFSVTDGDVFTIRRGNGGRLVVNQSAAVD